MEYKLNDYKTYPKYSYAKRVLYFGFKAVMFGKGKWEQNLTIGLQEDANIGDPFMQGVDVVKGAFKFGALKVIKFIVFLLVLSFVSFVVYILCKIFKGK